MKNRTVIIVNKKTKEQVKITWLEALRYYEKHATFEELQQKYKEVDNEDKKDKRKRSARNN